MKQGRAMQVLELSLNPTKKARFSSKVSAPRELPRYRRARRMAESKEPDLGDDLLGSGSDEEMEEEEEKEPELTQEEISDALLSACKSSDVEQCREMLEKWEGASLEESKDGVEPPSDWSALQWAATNGNYEIADMLLAKGFAAAYQRDSKDDGAGEEKQLPGSGTGSPLLWASYKGHEELVGLLAAAGVSIDARDDCGNNALHLASTGGHARTVRALLAMGTDVRSRNIYGNTALKLATDAAVRDLLGRADKQQKCAHSGEMFGNRWKYLCSCCDKFFTKDNTVEVQLQRKAGSPLWRLARLCLACRDDIATKEAALREAMEPDGGGRALADEDVTPLDAAVEAVGAIGGACGDVELLLRGQRVHAQLVAQLNLRDQLKVVNDTRPLQDSRGSELLVGAIAAAKEKDFDGKLASDVAEGERIVRASSHEIRLARHMLAFADVLCATAEAQAKDIEKLGDYIDAVRAEGEIETELGKRSCTLQSRLQIEVAMGGHIAAVAAARAEDDRKQEEHAKQLEEIDLLKGKKKKLAKKEMDAVEAAITSEMVNVALNDLKAKDEALAASSASATDDGLGVNPELRAKAEEEKKWLAAQIATVEEKFETKKAAEEKAAAKAAKKKGKK